MSKPNEEIEVKDQRKKSFYIADNRMIDEAAPVIGVYGGAVYNSLLRHADKDRKTWPSVTLMAKEWGISSRQVMRGIKTLEQYGLICVVRVFGKHNVYQINDSKDWTLPVTQTSDSQSPVKEETGDSQSRVERQTSDSQSREPVTDSHPKYNPITIPKKNLLSRMLFEEIVKANPHSRLCALTSKQKETRIADWAEDIEKLVRLDKQNYDVIEKVIKAALGDNFWSKNILSGEALRRNWDRLTQEFVKDKKLTNGGSKAKYYSQGKERQWFLNGKLIPADQVPEDIRKKAEGPPPPVSGPVISIVDNIAKKYKMPKNGSLQKGAP
jgi:hypothetical protein